MTEPTHPNVSLALARADAGIVALRISPHDLEAVKGAAEAFGRAHTVLKHHLGLAKLGAFEIPKPAPGPALFLEGGEAAPAAVVARQAVAEEVHLQAPLTEEEIKAWNDLEYDAQEMAWHEVLFEARARYMAVPGHTIEEWRAIHAKWADVGGSNHHAWAYLTNRLREGSIDFAWNHLCDGCREWLMPRFNGKIETTCWKCEQKARDAKRAKEKAAKAPAKASKPAAKPTKTKKTPVKDRLEAADGGEE